MSIQDQAQEYGITVEKVLAREAEVLAVSLWDYQAWEDEGTPECDRLTQIARKADRRWERRKEAAGGSAW